MTIWWHSGNRTLDVHFCYLFLFVSCLFLCQDLFCISFSWCFILRVYFTSVHHSLNFKHSVTLLVENPYFLHYRVFSSRNSSLFFGYLLLLLYNLESQIAECKFDQWPGMWNWIFCLFFVLLFESMRMILSSCFRKSHSIPYYYSL